MAGQADDRTFMPSPPIPPSPRRGTTSSRSSQPQSATPSAFSDATKLEALRLSGPNCWACLNTDPELAHVVSQKDGQALFWEQAGLFPFSQRSVANCIPLCGQCHRAFDRSSDPCYVFLPSDLQFFINWEVDDQHRRSQGILPRHRIVPGIEQYHNYQLSKRLIPEDAHGGLYCGYFLKDYLHDGLCPIDFLGHFTGGKPWHGHPLAAIRRGIAILGSGRCYVLDQSTIDQLTMLRRLYFNDPELIDQKLSKLYRIAPLDYKRKRQDEDDEDQGPNRKRPASSTHGENEKTPTNAVCLTSKEHNTTRTRHHESYVDTECVFGPSSTSDEAIRRFMPLLQSTDVVKLLG